MPYGNNISAMMRGITFIFSAFILEPLIIILKLTDNRVSILLRQFSQM